MNLTELAVAVVAGRAAVIGLLSTAMLPTDHADGKVAVSTIAFLLMHQDMSAYQSAPVFQ